MAEIQSSGAMYLQPDNPAPAVTSDRVVGMLHLEPVDQTVGAMARAVAFVIDLGVVELGIHHEGVTTVRTPPRC
jgi:hypothetical protein